MALQQTLGILLLVHSVAVALPQERKDLNKRRSNQNVEDFKLASDAQGNSEEYLPVKLGRTIYQSAWSIEDTASSEEKVQNAKSMREAQENNSWYLSNLLRLALNFVNKLKGESIFPEIKKSKNENLPRSTNKNLNKDKYLNLFQKWLRKIGILKKDDSISNYLLELDSNSNNYNHKNYQTKPKRKSFEHKIFSKKKNKIKNSESYIDNVNNKPQVLKQNNQDTSASSAINQDSKILTALYKANEYGSYSDDNCNFSETLDKNKQKDSNDSKNEDKINITAVGEENSSTDFKSGDSCGGTSTETVVSSSSESDEKIKNNHRKHEKHSINKSSGKISLKLQTMSTPVTDSIHFNPKHLQIPKVASLRAVTLSNVETIPNESDLNETLTKNTEEQVIKGTKPNQSQNTLRNLNIPKPVPKVQFDMDSFIETPTEHTSNYEQIKRPKTMNAKSYTDDINQLSSNQSSVGSSRFTDTPEENTSYSRVSKSRLHFTIPESVSSSEPQSRRALKENSNSLEGTKKIVYISSFAPQTTRENFPKETSSSFSETQNDSSTITFLSDSASQNQDKSSLKESSNYSQVIQTVSLVKIPINNYFSKTPYKTIPNKKQSDSQTTKSVPHVTMLLTVSPSKYQDTKTPKENSKDSQVNEKFSETPRPVSSSSLQTATKSLPKENFDNLPVIESILQATKSSKDSSFQLQEENTTGGILSDSEATETFSTLTPVNDSSAKTSKEKKNNMRENKSTPITTTAISVSSSEYQGIRTPKKNLDDAEMNKNISQIAIPVKPHENNPIKKQSYSRKNESVPIVILPSSKTQDIRTPTETSHNSQMSEKASKPAIVSPPKTVNENLNESQGIENDAREIIPVVVSSSKPQDINSLKENSKDSQMIETISNPAILVSNSSYQTTDKTIINETSNDLSETKSVSQTTKPSKYSPFSTLPLSISLSKPPSIGAIKKNSDVSLEVTLLNNSSPQIPDKNIVKNSSDYLPVASGGSLTMIPLADSPPQPQEKLTLKESSNDSQILDAIIVDPSKISKRQPQAEHITKETTKKSKIINYRSPLTVPFPQSNQNHILNDNFKSKEILTKPDKTSRNSDVNQKSIKTENTERKSEFETNHLLTKHEDSDIKPSENHNSDKFTFIEPESTIFKNKDSDIKNSQFEDLNSYIYSDETDLQHNKQVKASTTLSVEGSDKQKSKLTENQSLTSSFDKELSDINNEDQANKDDEQQEKYDTFLQYIYKHSNSSYFQALRNESTRL